MRALCRVLVLVVAAGAAGIAAAQEGYPPPRNVGGATIDALPLIGPYLLPTETPFDSVRIAFRGTDESTRSAGGAIHLGKAGVGERELRFAAAPKHVLDLTDLVPDCDYQYQLDLGGYESPIYRFRAAPEPGTRAPGGGQGGCVIRGGCYDVKVGTCAARRGTPLVGWPLSKLLVPHGFAFSAHQPAVGSARELRVVDPVCPASERSVRQSGPPFSAALG